MRLFLLPVLLIPAACCINACSFGPSHKATRTVEFTLPATGLRGLDCTSHNGAIVVSGIDADAYAVSVEITAFGETEAEAQANLALLEVGKEQVDGSLRLTGIKKPEWPSQYSPGFAFTITMPRDGEAKLTTHNGAVSVGGLTGRVAALTHNGSIKLDAPTTRFELETHNGGIEVASRAKGAIQGSLTTHNGGIEVTIGEGGSAQVSARTHNGAIVGDGAPKFERKSRTQGVATYGAGEGKIEAVTHNGSVRLR
jgi:hypothetical protein